MVDVKVVVFVVRDFNFKSIYDILLVEIVVDLVKSVIVEVVVIFIFVMDVINVLVGLLVGVNECIVVVNRSRNVILDIIRVVVVLDEGLVVGKSIVYVVVFRFVKNGGVIIFVVSYRVVVFVLSKIVG